MGQVDHLNAFIGAALSQPCLPDHMMPLLSVMAANEALNRAYESPLSEGLLFERRSFHAMFATRDQKEGAAAFVVKRKPEFIHR